MPIKKFRVNHLEAPHVVEETALRVGCVIGIGARNGWVSITPGGLWDTYPTCKSFDYVGIAKEKGPNRQKIWYSITVKGSSLQGVLWDGNPCDGGKPDDDDNTFPSAIASWEADEETWDSKEELFQVVEEMLRAKAEMLRAKEETLQVREEMLRAQEETLQVREEMLRAKEEAWQAKE